MEIRILTAEDAEFYRELRIEALMLAPDAFGATLEEALDKPVEITAEQLSSPSATTFGAFVGGRLLGNVTLKRHTAAKLQHRANVVAVYVTPSARGRRIASRLMDALIEHAKSLEGLEQLYLAVVTDNESAIELYKRSGFEKYGTEYRSMKVESRYIDEDLMVKFL